MATVLRVRVLDRDEAIGGLMKLRQEWQETGADLLETQASVGELLGDAARMIGLSSDEQRAALGDELYSKLTK
jgi:hypothetical protein